MPGCTIHVGMIMYTCMYVYMYVSACLETIHNRQRWPQDCAYSGLENDVHVVDDMFNISIQFYYLTSIKIILH